MFGEACGTAGASGTAELGGQEQVGDEEQHRWNAGSVAYAASAARLVVSPLPAVGHIAAQCLVEALLR